MENQEQQVKVDEINTLMKDIALSESVEEKTANVADLVPDNVASKENVQVKQLTLAEITSQFHYQGTFATDDFSYNFWNRISSLLVHFDRPFDHYYKYVSCGFELAFIFMSPPQEAGQVIFSVDNMPEPLSSQLWGSAVDSIEYQTRLPFKTATLGHNPIVVMNLEWNSPLRTTRVSRNVAQPYQYDGGMLRARLMNQRRAVTNVNTGRVQVWVRPTNLHFAGYQPPNTQV